MEPEKYNRELERRLKWVEHRDLQMSPSQGVVQYQAMLIFALKFVSYAKCLVIIHLVIAGCGRYYVAVAGLLIRRLSGK